MRAYARALGLLFLLIKEGPTCLFLLIKEGLTCLWPKSKQKMHMKKEMAGIGFKIFGWFDQDLNDPLVKETPGLS